MNNSKNKKNTKANEIKLNTSSEIINFLSKIIYNDHIKSYIIYNDFISLTYVREFETSKTGYPTTIPLFVIESKKAFSDESTLDEFKEKVIDFSINILLYLCQTYNAKYSDHRDYSLSVKHKMDIYELSTNENNYNRFPDGELYEINSGEFKSVFYFAFNLKDSRCESFNDTYKCKIIENVTNLIQYKEKLVHGEYTLRYINSII